ncbi:OmpH family outer membrane protein [candidate division WOR-3 bacterium]|nr:OmpH family outer membrane protein [candidate division WOR-3 bacterium]
MRKYMMVLIILLTIPLLSEQKIGYIDSQRILSEYKGAKEMREKYEKKVLEWKKKAEQIKKEIINLRETLQTQGLLLSEEAKMRKVKEIEDKENEYQQFIQSIWGQNGEAERMNQELMQPLLSEIDTLLTRIGEEEGFSMIFDASVGAVVYAKDELDVTDRIIQALNRKYQPETTGKIEYYVLKFREEDSETKSRNLGNRIRNLIGIAIKNTGGFKEIEPLPLKNAKNTLGIIKEEDVSISDAGELLRITDGNFIVIGRVWDEGGKIFLEFNVVDGEQKKAVITEEVEVGVEDNLEDRITNQVVGKIVKYY